MLKPTPSDADSQAAFVPCPVTASQTLDDYTHELRACLHDAECRYTSTSN